MAGNYLDVPNYRFAYDRDGTVATLWNFAVGGVELTDPEMATLNDEDVDTYAPFLVYSGGVDWALSFVFPELRTISGYWIATAVGGAFNADGPVQVSEDTTNGFDGTWTTLATVNRSSVIHPDYRTSIDLVADTGIRGIRFRWTLAGVGSHAAVFYAVHLYGHIPLDESVDRLVMWHPTLDEELPPAYMDWGDVPRGSTEDRDFRVKNLSATLTAEDIDVGIEAPSDTTPSVAGQHTFSDDGVTFTGSLAIGDLAPGALSDVLTVRRITPSNATLSLWTARIIADADSWS